MSTKHLILTPLVACSVLLLMGALNRQPSDATPIANAPFLAPPVELDAGLHELTPAQLLATAVNRLTPDKVSSFEVKIWQRQHDEQVSFEAEGRLVRGPGHCARLTMTIRHGAEPAQVLCVSDGHALAQVHQLPGKRPEVRTQGFTTLDKKPMTAVEIDAILSSRGCGGPFDLLKSLKQTLRNLVMDIVVWKGRAVLRLSAEVNEDVINLAAANLGAPPRSCRLFLHAQTLWPHRVEWWGARKDDDPARLLVELEFRHPRINQPLSREDCVREFTYLPAD